MKLLERHHKFLSQIISKTVMDDIVPMDCTPAAKWFLAESPKEYFDFRLDFPCVLAPAPVTWIEFEMPPIIRSEKLSVQRPARHVAALIMTLEVPEDDRDEFLRKDRLVEVYDHFRRQSKIRDGIEISADERQKSIQEAIDQELSARWVCVWQLMAEPLNRNALVPFVSYAFYLDQNGQLLDNLGIGYTMVRDPHEIPKESLNHVFADVLPFLFALSLTHCRNVELVERELPLPVIKKRKERGIPIFKFKQLVIKPVGGKQVIGNGQRSPGGGMMPLHFVRAHFRHYTEERPLFGKHSGTYFVGLHTRGKSDNGEVVKVYKVKPGETT